eukprot:GAHX01003007.1.p1 GENE.GAHX01003007.1~~GAHX01003007.1.p1  ORF type:complete len:175 (-),score=24.25 GAHX01003007.1:539-1063(-)
MKSRQTGHNTNGWFKTSIQRVKKSEMTPQEETIHVYKPIYFCLIGESASERRVTPNSFQSFDFRDSGEGWKFVQHTYDDVGFITYNETNLETHDSGLQTMEYLDQIFSKKGVTFESAIKPVTNFVQHKFFFDLQELVKQDKDQGDLLFKLVHASQTPNSATFDKLDETKLEEDT